jgi:GNAT superfamily N-acetyltransferase
MTITFERAEANRDRAPLIAMNVQYMEWIGQNIRRDISVELTDLIGRPIPDYVATTLDKLCEASPPEGVFYIARRDGQPAGMGGVRRLPDGVCEMKRVFVSPDQRGGGMGAIIVKRLIADAEAFGYARMRLESGPFMTSAHRLYEAEGFRDRGAYAGAEVPPELHHNWRFMERVLEPAKSVG